MASRRTNTRANPQGPLVTPVSDLEEILRRARDSLRQTSRAARGATSGISRGISVVISNRSPFQSSFSETSSSQKFISKSENFRVEESSSTVACEDLILGDSMKNEFSGDSTIFRCEKHLFLFWIGGLHLLNSLQFLVSYIQYLICPNGEIFYLSSKRRNKTILQNTSSSSTNAWIY